MPDVADLVVVLAPFRANAALVGALLHELGLTPVVVDDAASLDAAVRAGCGAVVISQEGLKRACLSPLALWLTAQPAWSELPIILVLDARSGGRNVLDLLQNTLPGAKLTILQGPVRKHELSNAVKAAVRARRRQLEIRDNLEWQLNVQQELSHRVKNMLASISAIYYMSLRGCTTLEAFTQGFEGRLNALSRVHGTAIASADGQEIHEISDNILSPYQSAELERITIAGPQLVIVAENVAPLGMCLHELATNAAKYGALSAAPGQVVWSWTIDAATDQLCMVWQESGGPLVIPPTREGYGTKFLRSAVRGMRGAMQADYHPQGLAVTITLPRQEILTAKSQKPAPSKAAVPEVTTPR